MAKGGKSLSSSRARETTRVSNAVPYSEENVQQVKSSLMSYLKIDRWNNNTAYSLGFNGDAQLVVEKIAAGDYGLATTIAKQMVERQGWNTYGSNVSKKQAYVLAKAAVENGLVENKGAFRIVDRKEIERDKQIKHERNVAKREAKMKSANETKEAIKRNAALKTGDKVEHPRLGEGKIISRTKDEIEIEFKDGVRKIRNDYRGLKKK